MSSIFMHWRKPAAAIGVALAAAATIGVATANADGPPHSEVEPQIIGGGEASEPYPWMATLAFVDGSGNDTGHQCGATEVFRTWVLTAAHCVEDPPTGLTAAQQDEMSAHFR